ncbi:MAG: FtsX-like permease family protein [Candidatus Hodarchaeota archaeon]
MSLGSFAISGFRYEKIRIFFLTITMIGATSSTIVSFAMERALAGQTSFNNIFISSFARFSWFIVILAFLTSLAFAWLILDALLTFRRKDLATMLSLGGIRGEIHAFFLAEIVLIFLLGVGLGVVLGLFFAFLYHLSLSFLGVLSDSLIAIPLLIGFIILILGGSYFLATFLLTLRTRKYYTQLIGETTVKIQSFLNQKVSHRFFSIKFALLTLSRRAMKVQYLSFFFVGFVLVTLALGGSIVKNTNIYYMEQAIGTDTYVLGHSEVTSVYVQNLAFTGQALAPSINLTNSKYQINTSLLSDLSQIALEVDARFLLYTYVRELAEIIPTESTSLEDIPYIVIGGNRSGYLYTFGLKNSISNWVLEDGSFVLNDTHIVIGNSVWYALFDDPFVEALRIYSPLFSNYQNFEVSGIIQDPFAAGMTCYMKLDSLLSRFLHTSSEIYNLVIVQVDSRNESALLDLAKQYGLSVEPLEPVKRANAEAQNSLWLLNLFSSIPLSLSMVGGIICVLIATAEEQKRDIQIIRALGGSKRQILRFSWVKTVFMILIPWIPAFLFGSFFSWSVLVSSPAPPDFWAVIWISLNFILSLVIGLVGSSVQSKKIYDSFLFP